MKLQSEGKLKSWVMSALVVVGALIIFVAIKWISSGALRITVASIGLVVSAIGGYSAKAQVLGLRPFGESSWRKAKRTYDQDGEERS